MEPAPDQRLGAIVFGSDQGLVGQFNQLIADYAIEQMNSLQVQPEERTILAVGARVAGRLEQEGQTVEESLHVPGGISGIMPIVEEMVVRIGSWRRGSGIERIVLFFNTPEERASYRPRSLRLIPIDTVWLQRLEEQPWPTHVLPTFTMDWSRLFAALIREYFFVSLYRAFAESLASENASRLASMQAAEKNIEERLTALNTQFHEVRQRSITEELLDVVAGFEVLRDEEE